MQLEIITTNSDQIPAKAVWDDELQDYVVCHAKTDEENWGIVPLAPQDQRAELILRWIYANYGTPRKKFKDGKIWSYPCSPKTSKTHGYNGRYFLEFIAENEVTAQTLEEYLHFLQSQDIPQNTKAARSTAAILILKRLSYFRSDLLPNGILVKMTSYIKRLSTAKKGTERGHTPQEIKDVEEVLHSLPEGAESINAWTQYTLYRYMGLRLDECCRIKVKNLDFDSSQLKMVRKKGNEEPLFLFDKAKEQLQKHIAYFGLKKEDFLFPSIKDPFKPYSNVTMWRYWKNIFFLAGCPKKRTVHHFRHYLAYWILEISEGNLLRVAEALGHKDLNTCQHYLDQWVRRKEMEKLNEKI